MNHRCQIYVLFDAEGNVNYVGRSSRPLYLRMNEHKATLGFKPKVKVVDSCTSDCRAVERRWIQHFRDLGANLRNVHYGQGPHFLPASARRRISQIQKGRPKPPGFGERVGAQQRGKPKAWSAAGRRKVEKNQFKSGHTMWDRMTVAQKLEWSKKAAESWQDPDRRRRMQSGILNRQRSAEERAIAGARLKERWAKHPKVYRRQALRASHMAIPVVKKFWADLRKDPARYRAWIDAREAKRIASRARIAASKAVLTH